MKKILLATQNKGKIEELKLFLKPYVETIISLKDLGDDEEVDEDQDTYEGNAIKKAKHFFDKYKIPTIADDSGLELALFPFYPGIYSARIGINDEMRNQIILEKLNHSNIREAKMISVIAFIYEDTYVFRGEIEGSITHHICGQEGFGYDKIFYIKDLEKTFGEVDKTIKLDISHRGIALKACLEKIKEITYERD